jgi:hypothetical protein
MGDRCHRWCLRLGCRCARPRHHLCPIVPSPNVPVRIRHESIEKPLIHQKYAVETRVCGLLVAAVVNNHCKIVTQENNSVVGKKCIFADFLLQKVTNKSSKIFFGTKNFTSRRPLRARHTSRLNGKKQSPLRKT